MASYTQAFEKVMVFSHQQGDVYTVEVEQLTCWQTMKNAGFSQSELYQLFKKQYCEEIWIQLRGDELEHQNVANFLFKASVKGYIDILLNDLQQHFALPNSGQICDQTLATINQLDVAALTTWLGLTIMYLENSLNQTEQAENCDATSCPQPAWVH